MEKEKKLRPFDLEAAKAGAPVCTRDGRQARILCWDLENSRYPIVAAVITIYGKEEITLYTSDGHFIEEGTSDNRDLMMAPAIREGWINIYRKGRTIVGGIVLDTEEEAKQSTSDDKDYITTIKIEWEEKP